MTAEYVMLNVVSRRARGGPVRSLLYLPCSFKVHDMASIFKLARRQCLFLLDVALYTTSACNS